MAQKKHESLEEILEEKRDYTAEQVKERTERTLKLFRVLVIVVGIMIALLVIAGIILR